MTGGNPWGILFIKFDEGTEGHHTRICQDILRDSVSFSAHYSLNCKSDIIAQRVQKVPVDITSLQYCGCHFPKVVSGDGGWDAVLV